MKAVAPGKLILSGEHAAVYGKPALAMAINRYVTSTVTKNSLPLIIFDLLDLSYKSQLSLTTLKKLKTRIKNNYHRFLEGDFKITEVLKKPPELVQFSLMLLLEMLHVKLTKGININVKSDIPIGCGMGSSAATIVSIIHAIAGHLQIKLPQELFLQLGIEAENLQHGLTSGLDLKVSLYGGCLYVKDGKIYDQRVPSLPMYLVNTGTPENSTGECVMATAPFFKSSSIGNDFATITENFANILQSPQLKNIYQIINENHALLVKIGVVPEKVQNFITEIQQHEAAAKICGAGAITGNKAGIVLVLTENETSLRKICSQYDYPIIPVKPEIRGVHII